MKKEVIYGEVKIKASIGEHRIRSNISENTKQQNRVHATPVGIHVVKLARHLDE